MTNSNKCQHKILKYLLEIQENNYGQNECNEAYCVADVVNYARCIS